MTHRALTVRMLSLLPSDAPQKQSPSIGPFSSRRCTDSNSTSSAASSTNERLRSVSVTKKYPVASLNSTFSSITAHCASNGTGRTAQKVIGEYELGKTIGKGTFGKVCLGRHILTGEKVAIKILEKSRIVEVADVERVSREIRILKRNRHMNVIQLYEVIDTSARVFLIMEYADNGEMFDFIVAHQRLPESLAVCLFQQLLHGIAHVHGNDITHRDLKPENILLQTCKASTTGYLLKIVDFGLSNTHEEGRLLKTACGSPCYAAPEMIQGKLVRFLSSFCYDDSIDR